jgi:hypothetical protein
VLIVENFLYLSKKTLSPCYNKVQITVATLKYTSKYKVLYLSYVTFHGKSKLDHMRKMVDTYIFNKYEM